ncbi:sulfatase [Chitinophaga lutea]
MKTLTFIAAIMAFSLQAAYAQQPQQPNILFIYMDDLGWTDVAAGSKYYESPNIDKLAKQGVVFSQAYSCGPNCAPSRASLLTGLYTPRHGIFTVGTSERGEASLRKLVPVKNNTVLSPSFVTIAEELKHAGYRTGLIGKWQLGEPEDGTGPQQQGFETVVSGRPGTQTYFFPYAKNKGKLHTGLEKGKEGEYLTDRLTDEAVNYIKTRDGRPFFLYLSYFAVHTPVEGKPALVDKYRGKKGNEQHFNPEYAAMIESADQGVGRLLKTLDEQGITKNTVVIFFSDNGGMGAVTHQYPLRGSKGMLYEGGVRVPLFVRWPGHTTAGATSADPVIGVDFYATLLDVAGIRQPLNGQTDGRSFAPQLNGKPAIAREAIYWHFPAYLEGFKGDKTNKDPFRTRPVSVIRSGDYKLHEFYEDGHVELYNIRTDIGETKNLAEAEPQRAAELLAKLKAWKTETQAPLPLTLNPSYTLSK